MGAEAHYVYLSHSRTQTTRPLLSAAFERCHRSMCGTKVLKQKSPKIEDAVLITSGRFFFFGPLLKGEKKHACGARFAARREAENR